MKEKLPDVTKKSKLQQNGTLVALKTRHDPDAGKAVKADDTGGPKKKKDSGDRSDQS